METSMAGVENILLRFVGDPQVDADPGASPSFQAEFHSNESILLIVWRLVERDVCPIRCSS